MAQGSYRKQKLLIQFYWGVSVIKEPGSGIQKMAVGVGFKYLKIVCIRQTGNPTGVPQAESEKEKKLFELNIRLYRAS